MTAPSAPTVSMGTAAPRVDEERDADEADGEPETARRGEPLPEGEPVEDRDPERDRADDRAATPDVDPLLGPGEPPVAPEEERTAEDRRRQDLLPADPLTGPRTRPQTSRIEPAMRWRADMVRNGGIVRTASSIAANVDPQTM